MSHKGSKRVCTVSRMQNGASRRRVSGSSHPANIPQLAVSGISVIASWGMFAGCGDPETRRRLAPFCILLTVQTLLLPLCDICSLCGFTPVASLFSGLYLLCFPLFILFVLVYPFCIRMNSVLWWTTAVFAVNLLVQFFPFVLILSAYLTYGGK